MQLEGNFFGIFTSYCLKGFIPLIGFATSLYLRFGLPLSLLIMFLLHSAIIVLYDLRNLKGSFLSGISFQETSKILKQCFPMMLSTLAIPSMNFLTRNAVEKVQGMTELGYYSVVTMVTVVFTTIAGSVFVVILPRISQKYMEGQKRYVFQTILVAIGVIFALALAAMLAAHWIGGWVFSIVFGEEILTYMYLLFPVIMSSAMLTVATLLSTYLIAMHKRVPLLIGMSAGVLLLSIIVIPTTRVYGMLGTTNAFIISLAVIIVSLFSVIVYNLYRCEIERIKNGIRKKLLGWKEG